MTYQEKLKDPRWQKKRLEILERDEWACRSCGDKDNTLHVHHKKYHGNPWESPDNELITYCKDCHNAAGKYDEYWEEIRDLINIYPLKSLPEWVNILNNITNHFHVNNSLQEIKRATYNWQSILHGALTGLLHERIDYLEGDNE